MAFTEKDMQAQEEQLSALKDELSRLNQKFDAQLKGMGLDGRRSQAAGGDDAGSGSARRQSEGRGQARRGSPQGASLPG